jgi:phospholipid transport system transporter-binding protein
VIRREGDRLQVFGNLTIQTAATLQQQGIPVDVPALSMDLSGVEAVDSAAVALLLGWQRQAQAQGVSLHFENLPANLLSLAKLYGVAELLPA